MSGFDPGPGWREIPHLGDRELPRDCLAYLPPEGAWRYWVPAEPLPTRPGYYLAARPSSGEKTVVELLYSPAGQWVDAGDHFYLTEEDVRALGPLRRLVPLDDVIRYFRTEAGPDAARDDWRLRAARTIEAEWETA